MSEKKITVISDLQNHIRFIDRKRLILKIPNSVVDPVTRVVLFFRSETPRFAKSLSLISVLNDDLSKIVFEKPLSQVDLKEVFVYEYQTPRYLTHLVIDIVANDPVMALVSDIKLLTVSSNLNIGD